MSKLSIAALAATALLTAIAPPQTGVINRFNPARTPVIDRLYDNSGNTTGPSTVLQGFVQIDGWPVTAEDWHATLSPGPKCWAINTARVNYHSGYPCTAANFVASVTAGISVTSDSQTISGTAASVPGGATHATTNVKYLQGPNNAYSTSNVIPSGAAAALMPYVMVAKGLTVTCHTVYGAGAVADDTTPSALADQIAVLRHGQKIFLRTAYDATWDYVHLLQTEDASSDYNADFQFKGWARIARATPLAQTPGAFFAVNLNTAVDADMLYIESDNSPAFKLAGLFALGNHSILAWLVTVTGHGKTQADVGDIYTLNSKGLTLAAVPTANTLLFLVPVTGSAASWALDSANPGTGTMVRTSGTGPNSGNLTVSATPVTAQFYPSLQSVVRSLLVDGRHVQSSGVYVGSLFRVHVDFSFPNVYKAYQALWGRTRDTTPFAINSPSIESQVYRHIEYEFDAYGVMTARVETQGLNQPFQLNFSWPMQWQPLTRRPASSETLKIFVPGTVSFQAGPSQSLGNAKDFGAGLLDVSSDTTNEYYFAAASWKPASHYVNNVQQPARSITMQVNSSGGTALRRLVSANSAIEGRTATTDYSAVSLYLSAPKKAYMADRYEVAITIPDTPTVSFGAMAMVNPAADAENLLGIPPFHIGGGRYEFPFATINPALDEHVIPIRAGLVGRKVTPVLRTTGVTVHSTEVEAIGDAGGIRVSTTQAGEFTALIS